MYFVKATLVPLWIKYRKELSAHVSSKGRNIIYII